MDRIRQIASLWNWLPAFRVVAETEHLPTAADKLKVTAPALSRSVKLLEGQLGVKLFRRSGRNIVLTGAGERFLAAVRDGMRLVHDGLSELQDDVYRGQVYVLASGLITSFLLVALRDVRRRYPHLHPHVVVELPFDSPKRLLRGELDLVLSSTPLQADGVTTEHLGEATSGIYCGPGHELYKRRKVSLDALTEHEFVAPYSADDTVVPDGWPPQIPRRVGMRVSLMHLGCEVCAQGKLLATLPDVVARSFAGGNVLHRLPLDLLPPSQLYATHRQQLGEHSRADVVLDAVRKYVSRDHLRLASFARPGPSGR